MSDLFFCPNCRTYHPENTPCTRGHPANPSRQSMLTHPLNQAILPPRAAPAPPAAAAATPARTTRRAATEIPATRHSVRVQKRLAKGKPTTWHYMAPGEGGVMERKSTRDRFEAMAHRRFRGRKRKGRQGEEGGEGQGGGEGGERERPGEEERGWREGQQVESEKEDDDDDDDDEEEEEQDVRGSDSEMMKALARSRDGWRRRAKKMEAKAGKLEVEVKRLQARLEEVEKEKEKEIIAVLDI